MNEIKEFKGTKTPWELHEGPDGFSILTSRPHPEGGYMVSEVAGVQGNTKHAQKIGDAKLIAAAPDLLEVLIDLRDGDYPQINGGLWDSINAAINKAIV